MKKYKNPESNVDEVRKCCKDVFHAFMVKGANYDGFYDMPIISSIESDGDAQFLNSKRKRPGFIPK